MGKPIVTATYAEHKALVAEIGADLDLMVRIMRERAADPRVQKAIVCHEQCARFAKQTADELAEAGAEYDARLNSLAERVERTTIKIGQNYEDDRAKVQYTGGSWRITYNAKLMEKLTEELPAIADGRKETWVEPRAKLGWK